MPELVEMLPSDDTGIDLPTEVTASLCHILNDLSQSDSQHAGAILNEGALPKIIGISSKDNGSVCLTLPSLFKEGVVQKQGTSEAYLE